MYVYQWLIIMCAISIVAFLLWLLISITGELLGLANKSLDKFIGRSSGNTWKDIPREIRCCTLGISFYILVVLVIYGGYQILFMQVNI